MSRNGTSKVSRKCAFSNKIHDFFGQFTEIDVNCNYSNKIETVAKTPLPKLVNTVF